MAVKVKKRQEDSYYTSFMNTLYDLLWKKIGVGLLVAGVILTPIVAIALAPLAQQNSSWTNRTVEPCKGESCSITDAVAGQHFPQWYHNEVIFDSTALTHVDLQREGQIVTTA